MNEFFAAVQRARTITQTGSLDKAARFINAEFAMTAYVSKGTLWAQYRNDKGELKVGTLV